MIGKYLRKALLLGCAAALIPGSGLALTTEQKQARENQLFDCQWAMMRMLALVHSEESRGVVGSDELDRMFALVGKYEFALLSIIHDNSDRAPNGDSVQQYYIVKLGEVRKSRNTLSDAEFIKMFKHCVGNEEQILAEGAALADEMYGYGSYLVYSNKIKERYRSIFSEMGAPAE